MISTSIGRLELISKTTGSNQDWQRDINLVFARMQSLGRIHLTNGCSMHVHVSPCAEGTGYSIKQLHGIMKSVAYYDDAITRVVPAGRKNNPWAGSNVLHKDCSPKIRDAYGKISSRTWGPLFKEIDKTRFKQQVTTDVFKDKYMSWNFMHVCSACGTVEFRRPPGVNNATNAIFWVAFTMGFIKAALDWNWDAENGKKAYPVVKTLRSFIIYGLQGMEPTCQGIIGTGDIVENLDPSLSFSTAERAVIERKKAAKANKESGYAAKVCNRPKTHC